MIIIKDETDTKEAESYEGVRILLLTGSSIDRRAAGAAIELKNITGGKLAVAVLGHSGESLKEADATYYLDDPDFADSDCRASGRICVALIKKVFPCDYVVCGTSSREGSSSSLAARIARGCDMEPSFSVSGIDRSDDGSLRTMRNGTAGSVSWKTAFSVSEGAWPKATPEMREGRRLNRIDVGLGVFSVGIKGSRVLIAKEVG
jgi:electron transfer flavoprotein alpha/beta subunit